MSLPSIPTDNLYKFLAVSGVVLVAVSIIFPLQRYDDYDRQRRRLLDLLKAQVELVKKQCNLAQKYVEAVAPRPEKRVDPNTLATTDASFEETMSALEIEWAKIGGNTDTLDRQLSTWLLEHNSYQRWLLASLGGGIVGVVMMVIGFTFWYFKLQRHQDRIIRLQAAEAGKNG